MGNPAEKPKKLAQKTRTKAFQPEIPTDAIPFNKAAKMLKDAQIEGLMSREPVRKAFHSGKLPGYVKGKNRIYFRPEPLFDLIGETFAAKAAETVDQALIRHFEASEFNTPITAMLEKLSPTITKADQVYREWHITKQNPLIIEAERKKRAQENEMQPEPSCKSCKRTMRGARENHERINREITAGRTSLELAEEHALAEFQELKCHECWTWLPHAPILVMHERLQTLGKHPSST